MESSIQRPKKVKKENRYNKSIKWKSIKNKSTEPIIGFLINWSKDWSREKNKAQIFNTKGLKREYH